MKSVMRVLYVAFLLLAAAPVHAQTVTATATWNQAELAGVATSFDYRLTVDATTPQLLQVNCVAAVAPATGSVCTAPFTLTAPAAVHKYILVASNAFGMATLSIGPGQVPGAGGFKVVVTVTFP